MKMLRISCWMYGAGVDETPFTVAVAVEGGDLLSLKNAIKLSRGISDEADLDLYTTSVPDDSNLTGHLLGWLPSPESRLLAKPSVLTVFETEKQPLVIVVYSELTLQCALSIKKSHVFPVKIPNRSFVSDLKNAIIAQKPNVFCDFDGIDIYRFCQSRKQLSLALKNLAGFNLGEPLEDEELFRVFRQPPPEHEVHVIVIHPELDLQCAMVSQNSCVFPATIARDRYVRDFKGLIMETGPWVLRNIDMDAINLYKFCQAKSDFSGAINHLTISALGPPLPEHRTLMDVFPLPPPEHQVHIIVGLLRVRYWILGRQYEEPIELQVPISASVGDLKRALREDHLALCDVSVDLLSLFKVPKDCSSLKLDELLTEIPHGGSPLGSGRCLDEIFGDVPLSQPLDIAVEIRSEKLTTNASLGSLVPEVLKSIKQDRYDFVTETPTIAPSSAAVPSNFKIKQDDLQTAIDCGRPRARYGPIPAILLHSVFFQFVRDCETAMVERHDNLFVERLAEVSSCFFEDEVSRVKAIDEEFRKYNLHFGGTQISSKYMVDKAMHVKNHPCAIIQYKNEMSGGSSEPYLQAIQYYLEWTRKTAIEYWKSPLPYLLVVISGPFMFFAGAAWNPRPTTQILSTPLALNFHPADSRYRLSVARHMVAFRRALEALEEHYNNLSLPSPTASIIPQLFPYPTSYKSRQSEETNHFEYEERKGRLLFLGKESNGDAICIKFVQRYCREAHEHLAKLKCAPSLRGFEAIGGGWYLVVMDTLSGYQTLHEHQECKPKANAIERLRKNLCSLHDAGYVHGDIRDTNIMVSASGAQLKVIDFDWAGKIGVVRYPALVNHEDIQRPENALDGKLIVEEDDHFMIDDIDALKCTNRIRCTDAIL